MDVSLFSTNSSLIDYDDRNFTFDTFENFSFLNITNGTISNTSIFVPTPIGWSFFKIGMLIAQILLMTVTIFGNMLVVGSVMIEKKLQTPFNYYIVNLALTDMNVGLSVMSIFTIYNVYGYFPFNSAVCAYWIWSDFTMTFESVATLAAISIDRFWSVTWSIHYRNNNSGSKSLLIIIVTWCVVNSVWLPAFVWDRLYNVYAPGECEWDPKRNLHTVVYVGILGYYLPLLVMLAAYTRIFHVMMKRMRQIAQSKKVEVSTVSAISQNESSDAGPTSAYQPINSPEPAGNPNQLRIPKQAGGGSSAAIVKKSEADVARSKRERKAFYTLGHIVIMFLICWIPFYSLFLINPLAPTFFPGWYQEFAYWMAYLNSAVNPVVYGVGNDDFRRSFKRIVTCRF